MLTARDGCCVNTPLLQVYINGAFLAFETEKYMVWFFFILIQLATRDEEFNSTILVILAFSASKN